MPRWQRIYLACCGAVIGYALAYALSDFGRWPRLTYFPVERVWRLTEQMTAAAPMNYYGTVLWGVSGAAVGAALMGGGARLLGRELDRNWLALVGAWSVTAVALSASYFLWNIWPF
jgi:NhaP-type Na+/H+ or K+/H+ antiporter